MKIKDIRKKSAGEQEKLIAETATQLQEFRFGMTGGQKKNVREARGLRKTIARLKTVLREGRSAL